MLNRFLAGKEAEKRGPKQRRPYLASEVTDLNEADKWRQQILREIGKKVMEIQNTGLGEHRCAECIVAERGGVQLFAPADSHGRAGVRAALSALPGLVAVRHRNVRWRLPRAQEWRRLALCKALRHCAASARIRSWITLLCCPLDKALLTNQRARKHMFHLFADPQDP